MNYIKTMPALYADALAQGPDRKLYNYKVGDEWKSHTYQEVYDMLPDLGFGLRSLGIEAQDKVGILSENRPEWCFFDWTCAHFNYVSVPVYQTSIPKQIEYILNHSECKVVVVSNEEQLKKLIPLKSKLKSLKYAILLEEVKHEETWVMTIEDLKKAGKKVRKTAKKSMQEIAATIKPENLWSIIYTSGSTGDPKGVLLTHFNVAANVQQTQDHEKFKSNKRWLSFLPLSHTFERVTSLFSFWIGAEIYFAESIAKVPDNLKEVKPHFMTTVPRLLEKIYSTVIEQVLAGPQVKQDIFNWAQKVGHKTAVKYLKDNKTPLGPLGLQYALAKRLVFNKIAAVFGGEFSRCVSGGAPLAPEIGEFFLMAGIRVLEGYGLTEMSPVTHANRNDHLVFGTVGKALPDVQTVIAPDGEILLKGPNQMQGYYKAPVETAEAIDKDGWFHTGDIGFIDEDGNLKITDRKKNIIITAGGKNIAPSAVEAEICSSKFIEQAIVIGDRRQYLVAILVPSLEIFAKWGKKQNPPLEFLTYADVATSKDVEKLIKDELASSQENLARYEQIKYFFIAPQPFTIETGELTASMKIKRNEVINKYDLEVEELYKN
ncbi:MAG: long-chain fatty acid--CoA ligase [Candidatus Marinimicrobia bacterium]|nr:long-chain fatty acid--CoA ligase [Candidatus Neomarinimicrobiota bacterium]